MDAHFEIDVDPVRHLVRTTLNGFFTPDAVAAYLAARKAAFARLRCPVIHHLALTDVRGMKIQSQDIVDAFGSVLADRRTQSRRLGFVVAPTLARQQLGRAIGRRDARCFTDMARAEAWLMAEDAAEGAA